MSEYIRMCDFIMNELVHNFEYEEDMSFDACFGSIVRFLITLDGNCEKYNEYCEQIYNLFEKRFYLIRKEYINILHKNIDECESIESLILLDLYITCDDKIIL